jgi:hypothetical protein
MGEEAAKSSIRGLASKAIKTVGGISSMMGKIASPVVKRLPIIGPGIETILSGIDISNMKDEYSKNKITLDQLQEMAGKRVISGIGGLLGSAGGAAIGGLLGSIVPGIGTAIAGFIGAVGGDYAGRFLGDIFSEYILPEKYKKSIGAFVTGTPAPKEEMQDFIIRNDKVYSFSNKDELVGMKTGGAIDSLLSGGGQQSTEYLKKVHEITISYLAQIAKNTRYMATHMNNGGSPSVINNTVPIPMPSGGSSPNIPLDDNRSGFFSSPYSLA